MSKFLQCLAVLAVLSVCVTGCGAKQEGVIATGDDVDQYNAPEGYDSNDDYDPGADK